MAGTGKYTEGKKFTLKSGNTTPFKQMGSTPAKHPHRERVAHGSLGHNTDSGKSTAEGGNPKPGHPGYIEKRVEEMGVEKKLKSVNRPSPAKQIGGDAGEVIDHWKKYQAAKMQDKAVEKLMTDKNISRKAFDTKLAKITKTVDPHASQGIKKGPEAIKPPKKAIVSKKPVSTLSGTAKSMQNVPKQFTKVTTTNLKSAGKQFATKAKGLGQGKLGKVVTKVAKKGVGKAISSAVPVISEALIVADILKEGVKRVTEGIKTGVPQTKLTGKHIKDTFKRAPKKKYTK